MKVENELPEKFSKLMDALPDELFDGAPARGAKFSIDRRYRFELWRIWDDSKPLIMFVGLNPSTANETDNDPTIKSVIRIARHNGYGGIYMMNCFAYVSTDPKALHDCGGYEENRESLLKVAAKCKHVVFAWGNFKIVKDELMDIELKKLFPNALALHVNKNGSPKHPLYCKSITKLVNFQTGVIVDL